jgi:hypothetical protein
MPRLSDLKVPEDYSPKEVRAFFFGLLQGRKFSDVPEAEVNALAVATASERAARSGSRRKLGNESLFNGKGLL